MTGKRLVVAAAAATALLTLSACSDAVSGSGQPGDDLQSSVAPTGSSGAPTPTSSAPTSGAATSGTASSSTPTGSSSSSSPGGFPTTVDSLGILLLKGITSIKSAHIELVESTGSTGVRGIGDETLADGKVTGIDLTETVGDVTLRFIGVGSKFYAKLPAEIYQSSKPWVELGPTTTDEKLKSLYTSFQQSIQNSAGQTITTFVDAAGSLKLLGTEQFDGTTVGHYALGVQVSKLPGSFEGKQALAQAGITQVPVDLYVDTQGRSRKVTEHLAVGSTTVDVRVTLTRIDQPVTIKAPPADQIGQS